MRCLGILSLVVVLGLGAAKGVASVVVDFDAAAATQTYAPSPALSAATAVDGVFSGSSRGWAISNHTGLDGYASQAAVFPLSSPLNMHSPVKFNFGFNDPGGSTQQILGRFEVYATTAAAPTAASNEAIWTRLTPTAAAFATAGGMQFGVSGDTVTYSGGAVPNFDSYSVTMGGPNLGAPVTAFRLKAMADTNYPSPGPSLPGPGPGLRSDGNFVLSNVTASHQVPVPTDSLMLWLDANDGLVHDSGAGTYTWSDRAAPYGAGVANHAVSSGTPTLVTMPNGMQAVQLDAYADRFAVAEPILTDDKDFSMFVVARAERNDNTALVGIRTGGGAPLVQLDQASGGQPRFILREESGSPTANATGPESFTGTWGIYGGTAQFNSAGPNTLRSTVFFNGTQQATQAVTGAANSVLTSDQYIGGLGINGLFWQGEIAEVLMFDRSLNELEFKQVNSYLDNKYALGAGYAPIQGPNDFSHAEKFTKQFTKIGPLIGWTGDDDGGFGEGGYVQSTASNSHQTAVFDTNGLVGGDGNVFGPNVTVDLDFRAAGAGSGVGIWFGGSTAEVDRAGKHWMFFQVDDGQVGGNDRARFFSGRNMATNSGGSAAGADYSIDTTLTSDEWMHLRLDIEQPEGSDQLTATLSAYDSQTYFHESTRVWQQSHTFSSNAFAWIASEIGVSLWAPGGAEAAIDNFAIYPLGEAPVPEPSTLALLAAGLALALLRRRRPARG